MSLHIIVNRSSTLHPYKAGRSTLGFRLTRVATLNRKANRRYVFGERHEDDVHPAKNRSERNILHVVHTTALTASLRFLVPLL